MLNKDNNLPQQIVLRRKLIFLSKISIKIGVIRHWLVSQLFFSPSVQFRASASRPLTWDLPDFSRALGINFLNQHERFLIPFFHERRNRNCRLYCATHLNGANGIHDTSLTTFWLKSRRPENVLHFESFLSPRASVRKSSSLATISTVHRHEFYDLIAPRTALTMKTTSKGHKRDP